MQSAVIYARLSVTKDESVSIERQLAAGRAYAESHGWSVIGEFTDDGVSATKNKPDDREGWSALLKFDQHYDHVIIWKIDRLARKVLDFVVADESLQARGAGLVSIKESLDLSTDIGRMIAMILATFAQMEAKAMGERQADARRYLLSNGRAAGGKVPFGYKNIANPNGPGKVVVKADTIAIVQEAIKLIQNGASLGSVCKLFNKDYSSVEVILRNPILAGLTVYTPGRKAEKTYDVLRDDNGLPLVNDDLAIISVADHRRLCDMLDSRKKPGTHDNDQQQKYLGLIKCHQGHIMYKSSAGKGFGYLRCKTCRMTIGLKGIESYIDQEIKLIDDMPVLEEVKEDNRDNIEAAIADTLKMLAVKATPELFDRLSALQSQRDAMPSVVKTYSTRLKYRDAGPEHLKKVLTVIVKPSTRRSPKFDADRVELVWSDDIAMIIPALKTNA